MKRRPTQKQNFELTGSVIRALQPPAKGNRVFYDHELPGFGVRVTANGARAFVLNYRTTSGRERRKTIGSYPDWTASDARKEARRLRHLIDEGLDPIAEREAQRKAPTVAELCDRFEAEHLPRCRPGTRVDYLNILRNHIRPHFGKHVKVADVVFTDVDRLHRKVTAAGHPRRANTVVAVLSKMFSLAVKWQMRSDNPCKGVEKNPKTKRKRYLIDDELPRLTAALATHEDKQAADIVRLLLLTGARRGEILAMRWADVDLTTGIWSKPASSTKQKQDHTVPLSAPARQLLGEIAQAQAGKHRPLGAFVFPGDGATGHRVEIKKDWRQLCWAANITGLRIHDLRHSFASQLASSGSSLPLIGALLGHSSAATTHRYTHLFVDPQRAAVERVGAAIIAAGGQPPAEPTPIKRRGA